MPKRKNILIALMYRAKFNESVKIVCIEVFKKELGNV